MQSLEGRLSHIVQEGISQLNSEFQVFKLETKSSLTHVQVRALASRQPLHLIMCIGRIESGICSPYFATSRMC